MVSNPKSEVKEVKKKKETAQEFYNRMVERIFKIFDEERVSASEALLIGKFIATEALQMILEATNKSQPPATQGQGLEENTVAKKPLPQVPYNMIGKGHGWSGSDSDIEEN